MYTGCKKKDENKHKRKNQQIRQWGKQTFVMKK